MDDTLRELENELKRLTPRRPSPRLMPALERDLATDRRAAPARATGPAATFNFWKWVAWPVVGVAATVLIAFALRSTLRRDAGVFPDARPSVAAHAPLKADATAAAASDRYEPVQASSVLYALQEGASATLPDRSQGREVRYRYVDTYTWKNPARNASVRWSVPRDEVRLVRANLD